MNENNDVTEWLWVGALAIFLFPFAALFGGARQWMLNTHIVVPADTAVLAIHEWGIGLDWPRLIILIAALALALTISASTLRRRRAAQRSSKR